MAIDILPPDDLPRAKVGFVGEMPSRPGRYQFAIREFQCEQISPAKLLNSRTLADLDAVIWTQDPLRPKELPGQIPEVIPTLLDHDVRVYIRLANDPGKTAIPRRQVVNALQRNRIPTDNFRPDEWEALPDDQQERRFNRLAPSVNIVDTAMRWPRIATLVCNHPAGPRPNLDLIFDETSLNERFGPDHHAERVLLLKRAFWNCDNLRLTFLDGGLSGAPVCKAYATLSAGQVPRGQTGKPYPHLYFIKIGPRKKIIDEYDQYCSKVLEYVPFHLCPRLRKDRCNLGSTQGILVGDFVEGTESLIDCARGGRCGHAIANLFDKTLAGWRKQALEDERPLASHLAEKWFREGTAAPLVVPPERAKIVERLGGEVGIAPLREIFDRFASTKPLYAPAHGDLHATNILVRHGDAIIIDFEKLRANYPLTYDPASLEGGLLVEGFIENLKRKKRKNSVTPKKLVEELRALYNLSVFQHRTHPLCHRGSLAEWYYDCVNQIRTLSWSSENVSGQYALTLALCLIRKGCNQNDSFSKEQNTLRAISFFFGQKILREFASHEASQS